MLRTRSSRGSNGAGCSNPASRRSRCCRSGNRGRPCWGRRCWAWSQWGPAGRAPPRTGTCRIGSWGTPPARLCLSSCPERRSSRQTAPRPRLIAAGSLQAPRPKLLPEARAAAISPLAAPSSLAAASTAGRARARVQRRRKTVRGRQLAATGLNAAAARLAPREARPGTRRANALRAPAPLPRRSSWAPQLRRKGSEPAGGTQSAALDE